MGYGIDTPEGSIEYTWNESTQSNDQTFTPYIDDSGTGLLPDVGNYGSDSVLYFASEYMDNGVFRADKFMESFIANTTKENSFDDGSMKSAVDKVNAVGGNGDKDEGFVASILRGAKTMFYGTPVMGADGKQVTDRLGRPVREGGLGDAGQAAVLAMAGNGIAGMMSYNDKKKAQETLSNRSDSEIRLMDAKTAQINNEQANQAGISKMRWGKPAGLLNATPFQQPTIYRPKVGG